MKMTQCIVFTTLTATLLMGLSGCVRMPNTVQPAKLNNNQAGIYHPILQGVQHSTTPVPCFAGATVMKVTQTRETLTERNDRADVNQPDAKSGDNYVNDNLSRDTASDKTKHLQEILLDGAITLAGKCIEFGHCGW